MCIRDRYSNDSIHGLSGNEAIQIAGSQRELIAVFDLGIGYNGREIAYKMYPGLSTEKIAGLEAELKAYMRTPVIFRSKLLKRKIRALKNVLASQGRGWDAIDSDAYPWDLAVTPFFGTTISHGTMVASVAAGDGKDVAVVPFRQIEGYFVTKGAAERFEESVFYAKALGVRVINMSYSLYFHTDEYFQKLIDESADLMSKAHLTELIEYLSLIHI